MSRARNPQEHPMGGRVAESRMPSMITPTVTELVRLLEPTTADTFVAGTTPVIASAPVRSRRIVD
jgi:hypothetical protein